MKKIVVNQSETIRLTDSEFTHIEINAKEEVSLNLLIEKQVQCSLFVECIEASKCNMNVQVKEDANCTLLFWNSYDGNLEAMDTAEIEHQGVLHLAYGELAKGNVKRKSTVILKEEGAEVSLRTAVLSKENKDFVLCCEHQARHTLSNMKNYYVLLENGTCRMDATGKINKGASGSKSHQVSKGLTFDQQKRAVIYPQLLIDENDVEASHATTLGQIDENQMYYLQSRGLSKKQATQLITTGYLMPIADEIEDEDLKERCQKEIETKVNESCSM